MPAPSLLPLEPVPGAPIELPGQGPITVGSAAGAIVRLDLAGDPAVHAILDHRPDGWWIAPAGGRAEVNGVDLTGEARLFDRDRIRLAGLQQFEFATGERRTRRMSSPAEMIARPRKRASGQLPKARRNRSFAAIGSAALAVLLVAGAAVVTWYGFFHAPKSIAVLTDQQATELDSLLSQAYDHVERGGTLLELGLGDGAAQEFARAINTLELSDLRNNPQVKPRIEALEASVASIYRERSLAVPENYANATSPLTPEQLKTASLSVEDFAAKFGLMAATFKATFGHEIIVSGRDHAEHVILYGKGGAMDLSIKTMTPGEIDWVVNQAHQFHIRVKDFSRDSVLRRQVANAVKSGLLFEAGTGLHIHIDRFANRRDRWTTLGNPASADGRPEFDKGRPLPRVVTPRRAPAG
jgi:hypothetical protein